MATATEIKNFIQKLGALAVTECNRRIANGKGFVLPSVCIAQSALETGWGTSSLMVKANAFFGIKAGGSWTGKVYRADTWEVANGVSYNTSANFRAYDSLADSVTDYYDLIGNNSRYSNALSFGTASGSWKTPKECITAIWQGGYATDTLYVEKVMNTINARNLAEYDKLIDGVTFTADIKDTVSFTFADLVQGSLIETDSGRSIANDTSDTKAIALDWNKAFAPNADGEYSIDVEHNSTGFSLTKTLHTVILRGDTPIFDSFTMGLGSFSAKAGDKIGFYITNIFGADVLLSDVEPIDIKIYFTPKQLGSDINISERYAKPIAYFKKIEH